MITAKFYNQDGTPSTTVQTGARVFEEKAQDWFATLNVSFSLWENIQMELRGHVDGTEEQER